MVKWFATRFFWGIVLIVGGIFFLLQNVFGWEFGAVFWSAAFTIGGLAFLSVYYNDHQMWWSLIPGFTLLGIGALIGLSAFSDRLAERWGGPLVLGSIGLAFLVVYLAHRDTWWPIIPAGTMFTLALIAGIDSRSPGAETGGLLFLGLGLTFGLVAVAPGGGAGRQWAWIPAGILFLLGALIFIASGQLLGYVWPIILIGVGAFLIFRTLVMRKE